MGVVLLPLSSLLPDICQAFVDTTASIDHQPAWKATMTSPIWHQIARHFSHVVFLQPSAVPAGLITFSKSYKNVAYYAAKHHMTINIAYLARMDKSRITAARQQQIQNLMQGNTEAGTLYVIEDNKLWERLKCT